MPSTLYRLPSPATVSGRPNGSDPSDICGAQTNSVGLFLVGWVGLCVCVCGSYCMYVMCMCVLCLSALR